MIEDTRPLMVTVRCITFNHAQYIRQCLDGIVMQKTNFRFEAIVHDDASTDGTADIVMEYAKKFPHIIKPILEKENQYSKGGFGLINTIMEDNYSYGKYIAECEGDDYWIDPLKLQKQVDRLDSYPEVTCVHTGFYTIDKEGNEIERPFYQECMRKSHNGNILRTLINGNYVMTLTTMYRRDVIYSDIYQNCPAKFDYTMTFAAAMLGDFVYLPEKTACYRRTPGSAMERMHSDLSDPLISAHKEVYSYFSKLIVEKKELPIIVRFFVRLHILVHLLKIKDDICLKSILKKDWMSKALFPFASIYIMLLRK